MNGNGISETVQMVQPNDILVIWSNDTFNPYYLIKSLTEPSLSIK